MLPILFALAARPATLSSLPTPPPVMREFRAVWVASVDNIDWPSSRTLSSEAQQAELIRILDRAAALKLNAVMLQVRPAADALYASSLEPWSEYLTGLQGRPPDPYYDPLAFAIQEAHKRGLQLHAWINPYRAKHPSAKGPLASNHVVVQDPSSVRTYGDLLWMDPGLPEVQARTLRVVEDIVRRYDVDGIHLDDYFYPYRIGTKEFPDQDSYRAFGHGQDKEEWRRQNVNRLVQDLNTMIHATKKWVQFGISPFGIYRPGIPAGIKAGVDQYAELGSDPVEWLRNGWCDYLSPQLYWPIAQKAQSFPVLLDWWRTQNPQGRHIWPGLYTSRLLTPRSKYTAQEIAYQIQLTRTSGSDAGHIHFSMKALMNDSGGIDEVLSGKTYATPAIPPASPWLSEGKPAKPAVTVESDGTVTWTPGDGDAPFWYVVSLRYGNKWQTQVLPGDVAQITPDRTASTGALSEVAVAAVNRSAVMSATSVTGMP